MVMLSLNSEALKIYEYCSSYLKEYEPWPNYFRQRKTELSTLLKFLKANKFGTILEIGCGCGFLSALLSPFSERIISSDLPFPDPTTHSLGLKRTKDLLNSLKLKNVEVIGGTIENIPLKDKSIDLVFSHCVLEHIPVESRQKSLHEIWRVLKPNGTVISILPNFLFSIYNFPRYYYDLSLKIAHFFFIAIFIKKKSAYKNIYSQKANKLKEIASGKKLHKMLLPPTHGTYRSRLQEVVKSLPFVWNKLFEKNGLKIKKTFTIRFIPYSNKLSVSLMEKTERLTSCIGSKIPFKYFGIHYCLICRKDQFIDKKKNED